MLGEMDMRHWLTQAQAELEALAGWKTSRPDCRPLARRSTTVDVFGPGVAGVAVTGGRS
jgi:hypothetical protein